MTDEQKARFCDEYCKHMDDSNKYINAAKHCATGKALQELIDYSQKRLSENCEKCILNEV